jgi:Lrp/AsnC family transcriptional regulator, leucine-responsive regulatory protein
MTLLFLLENKTIKQEKMSNPKKPAKKAPRSVDAATPLDRIDLRLLALLQADARLTTTELAERIALTTAPAWRRLRRLEEEGYVSGYHARLDAARLGWGVTAFVSVMLDKHTPAAGRAFEDQVRAIPQILECHNVSGRYDFLLRVVAADLESFGRFARDTIRALPGVKEMYSSFSLSEIKREAGVPLPEAGLR